MSDAPVHPGPTRPRHEGRRHLADAVRQAIWRMRDPEDMHDVLDRLRAGLLDLGMPILFCGVNRIATSPPDPVVISHTMNRSGSWRRLESGVQTVVDFWQRGVTVYRPDLHADDPHDERRYMGRVRCIVDVPFAQGTLAVNSPEPDAFSAEDIDILQEMAGLLEDGFRRIDEIRRAEVRLRVREKVWAMTGADDIEEVMVALREGFDELGFRYAACGINLVLLNHVDDDHVVMWHNMTRGADWTTLGRSPLPLVVDFWRGGRTVYRRDLTAHDPYGEQPAISDYYGKPPRSVIDVPFSHGTLALNSLEPNAFSDDQVALLEELAAVLEDGFRRLDDLKVLEERNAQLEGEVEERRRTEGRLERSLEEKEVLLREVHHRVKNNLQVVCSLLSLRAGGLTDPEAIASFNDSRAQIESMALIHERLYESDDLTALESDTFLRDLCHSVFASYGVDAERIGLRLDVEPGAVSVATAIECGLIVHELVSNCLKHAFPRGRGGCVEVSARLDGDETIVQIVDDGIGLADGSPPEHSMGLRLVDDLTRKLGGRLVVATDGGTRFSVRFPTKGRHDGADAVTAPTSPSTSRRAGAGAPSPRR